MSTAANPPLVDRQASAGAANATLAWLALIAAVAIWATDLRAIDPGMMTDLGLASTMAPLGWLPLGLLSIGFFMLIGGREHSRTLAVCYIVALIVFLHVTPILEYGTLRYPWTWKHLGLVDYFQRHGVLNPASPLLGAYHNWPGLFAAVAMIDELIGVEDISAVVNWWPPVATALCVMALATIIRQFTSDGRVIYAALWMFICGNWIGQDYFSPQSAAYIFYLALLSVCLTFIVKPSLAMTDTTPTPSAVAGGRRVLPTGLGQYLLDGFPDGKALGKLPLAGGRTMTAASGIALFLIAAITPTHQFTPIIVIVVLAAFVVLRLAGPGLLLFAAVCFAFWTMYAASPYLAAHLSSEVREAGTVTNFTSKLIDTGAVSYGQAIVSWASRGLTVAIGLAAFVGFVRRFAAGYRDIVPVILVLVPIPIGLATSYGGEIIFRVYLFALPGLAFFAAASIFPTPDKGRALAMRAAAAVFGLALAVGFVLANNGKDRQYVPSQDEISSVEWLYTTAPANSLLIEGASIYPRQMRNYENFSYVALADEPAESINQFLADPANVLADWLNDDEYAASFVIITRSQKAYVDAVRPLPSGTLDDIEQQLMASPRFLLVHATDDVKIFTLNKAVQSMGGWVTP